MGVGPNETVCQQIEAENAAGVCWHYKHALPMSQRHDVQPSARIEQHAVTPVTHGAERLRKEGLARSWVQRDKSKFGVLLQESIEAAMNWQGRAEEVAVVSFDGLVCGGDLPHQIAALQVVSVQPIVIDRRAERAEIARHLFFDHLDMRGRRRHGQVIDGVDASAVGAQRSEQRVLHQQRPGAEIVAGEPIVHLHLGAGAGDFK